MYSSPPLADRLAGGSFVRTAELAPPRGTDTAPALALADTLGGRVDAFNVTDNQNARLRLSPLAFSRLLRERGHEAVCQLTCRDRNRLALQSDLLGAWALGIRTVLALTGDHVSAGDHPDAAPVFDLDAVQLLAAIDGLNRGADLVGKPLRGMPALFAGAALSCDQQPREMALMRFRKKIAAGARFFQTQAVFRPESLEPFFHVARQEGVYLLAGILVLHSTRMVRHINLKVPGLSVPGDIAERLEKADDAAAAGQEEALRLVEACRPFCHGVHLMAAGRDELLPELLDRIAPG